MLNKNFNIRLLSALIFLVLFFSANLKAQYSVNKLKYDYRDYTYEYTDKYNPAAAGIKSYLITGLGQMTCGEKARGFKFLGGSFASLLTTIVGVAGIAPAMFTTQKVDPIFLGLFFAGYTAGFVVKIYSISDAVRVAKVNNMALRGKI